MKKIENIESYTIDIESVAYHCLSKFEINNVGTLLVLKKSTVIGTITDGDIRKALINNRLLSIPIRIIMKSDYKFGRDEHECREIFNLYPFIFMVPLIGDNRELIDIYIRDI